MLRLILSLIFDVSNSIKLNFKMLQYTIDVLKRVSFNAMLFKRELKKSLKWLIPSEVEILKRWVRRFVSDKPRLQEALVVIND